MPKRLGRERLRTVMAVAALGLDEYLECLDEADAAAWLPVTPWRSGCRRVLQRVAALSEGGPRGC